MTTNNTTPTPAAIRFAEKLATYIERRDTLNSSEVDGAGELALIDAANATEQELLATPATSVSDLRAKAEVIWQDPASLPTNDMLVQFFTDLRKLSSNEPSRTFNANEWLDYFTEGHGGWADTGSDIVLLFPETVDADDRSAHARWILETRGAHSLAKDAIRERAELRESEEALSFAERIAIYEATHDRLGEHGKIVCPPLGKECDAYEARMATLCDDLCAAVKLVMECAAPDSAAMARKLEIFTKEQLVGWNEAHSFVQLIEADAKRLAGAA